MAAGQWGCVLRLQLTLPPFLPAFSQVLISTVGVNMAIVATPYGGLRSPKSELIANGRLSSSCRWLLLPTMMNSLHKELCVALHVF